MTFFSGTYSGSGRYVVGDDSEIRSSQGGTLFQGAQFTAENEDGNERNNVIRNTSNMDLSGVTFGEGLLVTNDGAQSFDLFGDVTNNGLFELSGTASGNTRLFFSHPASEACLLYTSPSPRDRG